MYRWGYVYKKKDMEAFSSTTRLSWVVDQSMEGWCAAACGRGMDAELKNWRGKISEKINSNKNKKLERIK